jgi:hypothetical protein
VGKVILHHSVESLHIDSHVELGQFLKASEPATREFLRGMFVAEEPLEIGGGELDEALEEVPLFSVVARCMPESLEDFMTFPPVGEVIKIDSI